MLRHKCLRSFAVCLWWLSAIAVAGAEAKPLQSPWDLHPVALTQAAYSCPAAPRLPRDLNVNSYYSDSHHSIVDTAKQKTYQDATEPIEDFSRAVVKAADDYLQNGSRAAAECVAALLAAAANDKVLTGEMETGQSHYVQGWQLGAWAVAYLKVRGSGAVTAEQSRQIASWFKRLAEGTRAYFDERRAKPGVNDAHNNHLYWAGFAIAAAGVASNDAKFFRWGMDAYREGIRDITPEGTLPREMDRAGRALHYHLAALAPLVMLAEFGEANGEDLYAERDFAIKRLVPRCISGLEDPAYFVQKTGVKQDMPGEITAGEMGWAVPYVRRFPDPRISALLAKAPSTRYTTWGGLPPP